MRFFKDRADFQTTATIMFSHIVDRHNRFALFQNFPENVASAVRRC